MFLWIYQEVMSIFVLSNLHVSYPRRGMKAMENNLGRIVEDLRYIPYIYEQKKNIIIHNLDEDINQFVIENSKDLIVLESQSASINAYDSFISLPKNPII